VKISVLWLLRKIRTVYTLENCEQHRALHSSRAPVAVRIIMSAGRTLGHGNLVNCWLFINLVREAVFTVAILAAVIANPVLFLVVFECHIPVYTLSFADLTRRAIFDSHVNVQFLFDERMVPHEANT